VQDHTKVILCPLLGALTYIDEQRMNRTFRFDLLEKFGCSLDIASRLSYAYDKVTTFPPSQSISSLTVSAVILFLLSIVWNIVQLSGTSSFCGVTFFGTFSTLKI
jgi:hypothetical protein